LSKRCSAARTILVVISRYVVAGVEGAPAKAPGCVRRIWSPVPEDPAIRRAQTRVARWTDYTARF